MMPRCFRCAIEGGPCFVEPQLNGGIVRIADGASNVVIECTPHAGNFIHEIGQRLPQWWRGCGLGKGEGGAGVPLGYQMLVYALDCSGWVSACYVVECWPLLLFKQIDDLNISLAAAVVAEQICLRAEAIPKRKIMSAAKRAGQQRAPKRVLVFGGIGHDINLFRNS